MRKRSFRFRSASAALEYMGTLLQAGFSFEVMPAYKPQSEGEGEPLKFVDIITPFAIDPEFFPDPRAMVAQ
jgi:hypothetical protein